MLDVVFALCVCLCVMVAPLRFLCGVVCYTACGRVCACVRWCFCLLMCGWCVLWCVGRRYLLWCAVCCCCCWVGVVGSWLVAGCVLVLCWLASGWWLCVVCRVVCIVCWSL